jgi:predicted transcriptional regulator
LCDCIVFADVAPIIIIPYITVTTGAAIISIFTPTTIFVDVATIVIIFIFILIGVDVSETNAILYVFRYVAGIGGTWNKLSCVLSTRS